MRIIKWRGNFALYVLLCDCVTINVTSRYILGYTKVGRYSSSEGFQPKYLNQSIVGTILRSTRNRNTMVTEIPPVTFT